MVLNFQSHVVRAVAVTVFIVAGGAVPSAEAAPPSCYDAAATIVGTEGDDVLTGTPGPDVMAGLGGADTIRGRDGDDKICGGAGADLLSGGEGVDKVDGGAGADDLRLGPNPVLWIPVPDEPPEECCEVREWGFGGAGDDVIDAGSGNDDVGGGEGDDRISAGSGDDTISGDEGDDVMRGGKGGDRFGGGGGNDTAYGDSGGDSWRGYGNARGDVDHFYGGTGDDSTEIWDDVGQQILHGGAGDDHLEGGNGADVIRGGPGNDRLAGFLGDDSLRGGSGKDLVDYSASFHDGSWSDNELPVRVDLRSGRATGLGRDTLSSVEGVNGGTGKDLLLGSSGANTFGLGVNYLQGNPLEGDVIKGRGGRDTLTPQVWVSDTGGMRVDLAAGRAQFESHPPATISSIEIVIGTDTPYSHDVLLGDEHANTLRGRGGDDIISGHGGNDQLSGGAGRDKLRGGAGRDVLSGGSGNDDLSGGSGRDRNYGGPGQDRCTSPATGRLARSCELH
jgi:Ca2+-binding RTX toxin-like protein